MGPPIVGFEVPQSLIETPFNLSGRFSYEVSAGLIDPKLLTFHPATCENWVSLFSAVKHWDTHYKLSWSTKVVAGNITAAAIGLQDVPREGDFRNNDLLRLVDSIPKLNSYDKPHPSGVNSGPAGGGNTDSTGGGKKDSAGQ
ncbi:hypothetical protein OAG68_02545 [bacterium]|nr:hypothetical protein [bacterium]